MIENIQNLVVVELNVNAAYQNVAASNENARLIEEYMVPSIVESPFSIVYPTFD